MHWQSLLHSSPALQTMLHRYAAVHGLQVAQTAGCNRLHDLEQRLWRWLLLTQDRVGSGLLRITHDFLAMMLGTDRPSVSLAAGGLQKKHDHRICARLGTNSEPQETGKLGLRMLRDYSGIQRRAGAEVGPAFSRVTVFGIPALASPSRYAEAVAT